MKTFKEILFQFNSADGDDAFYLEDIEKAVTEFTAQFTPQPPKLSAEDITESLRNSYFKETGEQALTNDYALWCENKIVDHRQYIQQPQPPYGREVPADFLEFVKNEKLKFCKAIIGQEWNTELRTAAENFVIAYNQMMDRIQVSNDLPAQVEGYSKEDMKQCARRFFDHWLNSPVDDILKILDDWFPDYIESIPVTLPAPQGYTKSQMEECWDKAVEWRNGVIYSGAVSNPCPDKDTYLPSLSPAPEQ